jgi:AcrR family transcriptional regulator
MTDTKSKLKRAAIDTVVLRGIAGTSARTIAETAQLSQGLIFYHFGSVNALLEAATREVTAARAAVYRDRLAQVSSMIELARLARELHDEERRLGNVTMMAQLLAGAHTHSDLAPVARANFDLLVAEVRLALERLLAGSALADVLPADHVAHLVSAAFVGIELLPDTRDARAAAPGLYDTVDDLAHLVDTLLSLGPTTTAALRRGLDRGRR